MAEAYPIPKFHFEVSWANAANGSIVCSEASGLNSSIASIEYRDGKSPQFYNIKSPGLQTFSDVVLSKAIFQDDADFQAWHDLVATDRDAFRDVVTIVLKNELGEPVLSWELQDAWVSNWEMPDMNSTANEVAIEKITIVSENIMVTAG
ncbi:MAG TPA: phage tail protein [Bacteroidales bacterium]|nr:phage tail protein [Bacteroidales bacterium]